ncbi:lantibiotic dehydratase [Dactylosporangium sp. NPDC051541]|uniref:lantibiotic dehydratase n=1 Tax=Dactylosporangium sp. NPDC051541 TaxID=3363977 RepID=UPI00379DFDAD
MERLPEDGVDLDATDIRERNFHTMSLGSASERSAGVFAASSLDPDGPAVDLVDGSGSVGSIALPGGVDVVSPVVVRIAGLPAGVLRDLRLVESFSLAGSIARALQCLRVESAALSDDLFFTIRGCVPGVEKGALVGLRRAVFQLRAPNGREWNEQVAELLSTDVAERLRDWISRLEQCGRLRAALPDVLARELAAKQAVLRDVVGRPWFRHALSLASPSLFGETTKWLADDTHVPRRGSLVRLAKYAARAAAKTSPYSTFTISGWCSWTAGGPGVRFGDLRSAVGVLELSGFLQAGLRVALRDDPRLAVALPLRLNPSATAVDGTVRFLGPPPHESIVSVPALPMVLECLRILDDGASLPRAELRVALDAGDVPDPGVDRLLDRLLEVGLLERPLMVADLSTDPFGELSSWLSSSGAEDLGAAIDLTGSRLRHPVPVHLIADHIRHQQALGAAVEALGERTDLPVRQLAEQQVDLWHENAVFTERAGQLSASVWRPALADLDVVRRVLAVLDQALPMRVALGAYCGERFGSGSRVPFLTLYEAVARDLARRPPSDGGPVMDEIMDRLRTFSGTARPSLRDSRLVRLRELDQLRQSLQAAVLTSPDPDGVIRADADALGRLAATWPRWITAPDSIACYLQTILDGDSLRLVVNAAHGGQGRGRSRALHLIREAGGQAPFEAAIVAGRSAAAELGGLFGFAPNVRLAGAPYEIDYPFAVSGRPGGERLPLRRLTVGHDPVLGIASLFGPGVTSPIKALHLGMMADFLLPPAARLLTQAFGSGYLIHAGVPIFTALPSAPTAATVVRFPRVEIGRVVVRRARWVAPKAQVPMRDKGEPDAGFLLRIAQWLLAREMPSRCFVRMNDAPVADGPGGGGRFDKSRKPVYVDFANWYLVQAFERMLADAGPVIVFEEVLPAVHDAIGPEHGPASVSEFIVELRAPERHDG